MRVLVVEDDRALGLFLQKGLMMEGHDVAWVGDGEAALCDAEAHPPDLMVLDLGLPRRDGTEVLEAVRRDFASTAVLVRASLHSRGRFACHPPPGHPPPPRSPPLGASSADPASLPQGPLLTVRSFRFLESPQKQRRTLALPVPLPLLPT